MDASQIQCQLLIEENGSYVFTHITCTTIVMIESKCWRKNVYLEKNIFIFFVEKYQRKGKKSNKRLGKKNKKSGKKNKKLGRKRRN